MAKSNPHRDKDTGKASPEMASAPQAPALPPELAADVVRTAARECSKQLPALESLLGLPPLRYAHSPSRYSYAVPPSAYATATHYSELLRELSAAATRPKEKALEQQILELRSELDKKAEEAATATAGEQEQRKRFQELQSAHEELMRKQDLRHLVDRVGDPARSALLEGGLLRSLFERTQLCDAFVMSIDIRRSTELMLKARAPQVFADFITSLCSTLSGIIVGNFGVFDKFTGDGILAFFPDFYSGEDGGFRAVTAADQCHAAFSEHYRKSRACFVSVLRDAGLGIGIDFGKVRIVRVRNDLTVVGTPVVYACRMGGASAGQTLLNQPAYEVIFEKFSAYCNFVETEINFKHEGSTLAYLVALNSKLYQPKEPAWLAKSTAESQEQSTEEPEEANG